MLKVIHADFEKGDYLIRSTITGYFYQVNNYDGLMVDTANLNEKTFYWESPTEFTVRGCRDERAAVLKIKRKVTVIDNVYIAKLRGLA